MRYSAEPQQVYSILVRQEGVIQAAETGKAGGKRPACVGGGARHPAGKAGVPEQAGDSPCFVQRSSSPR